MASWISLCSCLDLCLLYILGMRLYVYTDTEPVVALQPQPSEFGKSKSRVSGDREDQHERCALSQHTQ